MSKKIAVINVNLEYEFSDNMTDEEIELAMQEIELPKEYICDSYEFVKIVEED